jgi:hypothetical protein
MKIIAICLACLALTGCLSRKEVQATAWLQTGLPPEICASNPDLKDYGIYRKLDSGKFEFVSICDKEITRWISIYDEDFKRILDALVPERDDD